MKYCPAQICLNGHIITENATIPKNCKDICPRCNERTITKCPDCKASILGMAISGKAYGFYDKNKPPSHCHKCKQPYPWTKSEVIGYMNINDILTEIEYTKERSAEELFEFVEQKEKELQRWNPEHSDAKTRREIRYRVHGKGLPDKFAHELTPFAYYANAYYGNKPEVRFKPCCGSEHFDGIIVDNDGEVFVEIANAIAGRKWGLQKELLIENGCSPWEHNIHGVKGNKTKRNRSASDIIISSDSPNHKETLCTAKELVKKAANKKCKKSMEQKLPYGENKTILIITFDDTVFFIESDWNDLVNFKQDEIDCMEHNFINIILFGWISKKFMPENL